ncbi:MAG: sugar phosphate isomerase/epimerase [Spirochaetes bacterium]|nr:MAG: sugar phosphate isomerase/epimerase [Spirochaetota bacterium]
MEKESYRFPLSVQLVLPDDYRENDVFKRQLEILKSLGFSGVELNIENPGNVVLADIIRFLKSYNLRFSMFASGLTAKTLNLSLSAADEGERRRAVEECRAVVDFLANTKIPVIMGYIKGPGVPYRDRAVEQFKKSLKELAPYAKMKEVTLIVEATNRYETPVANSLKEAVEIVREAGNRFTRVLPDTFHMNIEEADMFSALKECRDYYNHLHLSDNNRFFPGLGAIDFRRIVDFIKEMDYRGSLAIEGNIKNSFEEDIKESMEYLAPLLK